MLGREFSQDQRLRCPLNGCKLTEGEINTKFRQVSKMYETVLSVKSKTNCSNMVNHRLSAAKLTVFCPTETKPNWESESMGNGINPPDVLT